MTKICSKCSTEKEVKEFNSSKRQKDGYHVWCKVCVKIHDQDRHRLLSPTRVVQNRERRASTREFISSLKMKCTQCPEEHISCLEFHHLGDDKKDFNISDAVRRGYSQKRILEEVKKCVILCANCHRKFHFNERTNGSFV